MLRLRQRRFDRADDLMRALVGRYRYETLHGLPDAGKP